VDLVLRRAGMDLMLGIRIFFILIVVLPFLHVCSLPLLYLVVYLSSTLCRSLAVELVPHREEAETSAR
jgi:formate-dependent nitrite reductase membrane component NrfD